MTVEELIDLLTEAKVEGYGKLKASFPSESGPCEVKGGDISLSIDNVGIYFELKG